MSEKSINEVFAENLKFYMGKQKLSQPALAEKCKVSQKTISNCLNPSQRDAGASGAERSATLAKVATLAKALGVEPWKMLRSFTDQERAAYEQIEAAFRALNNRQQHQDDLPDPQLTEEEKDRARRLTEAAHAGEKFNLSQHGAKKSIT